MPPAEGRGNCFRTILAVCAGTPQCGRSQLQTSRNCLSVNILNEWSMSVLWSVEDCPNSSGAKVFGGPLVGPAKLDQLDLGIGQSL